jgi:hypothetical protein
MAYGNYGGNYYNPYMTAATQPPQVQVPQQPQTQSSILWVQGEAGAKAYPVGAGNSVLLMDTEDSVMYIKTVDVSGMPQPLRVFDYVERSAQGRSGAAAVANADTVTREEFEALREDVRRLSKGVRKPNLTEDE